MLIYYLIILLIIGSNGTSLNNSEDLEPTLEIILLVHSFNKYHVLPFTLGGIESQDYSKKRIKLYINFEAYENIELRRFNNNDVRLEYNSITYSIINKWIESNSDLYFDIAFNVNFISDHEDSDVVTYWDHKRFEKIMKLKTRAMNNAKKSWADFVLFIDSDVILTNKNTFTTMIEANLNIISPMLYSLGTYSNFWAGMNENGYYQRTEDYIPILERNKKGSFEVPMVHSCVFINLRKNKTHLLSFESSSLFKAPFDDILSFASSAHENNISLVVNNEQVWGYILPPTDMLDMDIARQDLIDLELESLIEGPRFPIAKSIHYFVSRPPKDKLGMDEVFIINLERRDLRRKRMNDIMTVAGIDGIFFPAVDGKLLNNSYLKEEGISILPGYLDPYHKRPMTFGEIGCFLTHYKIWRFMLDQDMEKVIVFEDDAHLERRFKAKLKEYLKSISEHWSKIDFIYLGRKPQNDEKETPFIINHFVKPSYSYWTIGYIITASGARKLIDANPLKNILPVDEFLPIMFNEHPNKEWAHYYPKRNLRALSVAPLLVYPSHYVGDELYFSDTETSEKITNSHEHPKHTEL